MTSRPDRGLAAILDTLHAEAVAPYEAIERGANHPHFGLTINVDNSPGRVSGVTEHAGKLVYEVTWIDPTTGTGYETSVHVSASAVGEAVLEAFAAAEKRAAEMAQAYAVNEVESRAAQEVTAREVATGLVATALETVEVIAAVARAYAAELGATVAPSEFPFLVQRLSTLTRVGGAMDEQEGNRIARMVADREPGEVFLLTGPRGAVAKFRGEVNLEQV